MSGPVQEPSYLIRWDHSRDQRLGRDVVQTTHRLAELPIFSDEGLATLLDEFPRDAIEASTTGNNPAHPSQLRIGQLGDHSGAELVNMLRRGRLRLRLHRIDEHHAALRQIVHRLCHEISECQGLSTLHYEGDLEICSPQTLVYYHCDLDPNIFWQVRGCRSIWVYPAREPYLLTRAIERMLAGERGNHLYYEPAFDDSAHREVQTSGDAIALPQQTPYRVVNDQHLSVTLTTSYVTAESRRKNETLLANHALQRYLPSALQSDGGYGVRAAVKRAISRIAGAERRDQRCEVKPPSFQVDPHAPNCVGSLDSAITQFPPPRSVVSNIDTPLNSPATAPSEN